MNKNKVKQEKRIRRRGRVRAKVSGTAKCPRLSVYRSLTSIYVQLIDDEKEATLVSATDKDLKGTKSEKAKEVGKLIATKAKEKGIECVVFDRGGFKYQGRVQALAEGAREAGLKF